MEKVKLEERKRQLEEEKAKVIAELKELNVTEDQLEEKIEELEVQLQTGVMECQKVLNQN